MKYSILITLAIFWVASSSAQQGVGSSPEPNTRTLGATFTTPIWHTGKASDWDLSASEWSRYQILMQGEAGLYYTHLEPSFVLGIYAKDDAERDRMARIVYQAEHARTKKLFDFNRAYTKLAMTQGGSSFDAKLQKEFDLLYKGKLASMSLTPPSSPAKQVTSRQVLVINSDCDACDVAMRTILTANQAVDVYFVDATDEQIRQWANKVKVPVNDVKRGHITLNHDSKNWFTNVNDFPLQYASGDKQ